MTEAKNLTQVEPLKNGLAGATQQDAKGKIIEYSWWLKKQDYAEISIRIYTNAIQVLKKRGADIFNPEIAKSVMAKQKWGQARKNVVINAYTLFLKMCGTTWTPPIYRKPVRKLPFIPTETEIDQLTAACGKKTAAFLQLLKETAMRSGEANRIEWSNLDSQRKTVTLNYPEKNGNPRIFRVSQKVIDMLNALPKEHRRIFGHSANWYRSTFYKSRKRIAHKLQNPRLMKIHLHTLRHWKATTLYHQTKDILYVKEFLGHKRIEDTMLYIQVAEAIFRETTDEFTVRVAKESEEIQGLLGVGFEYVCEKDGLMFFRKRK
ncbi:MAG: tyrosine-type recombinase/integrase [Candidatus Bathyarchaeota archaeon]|nr:MAG: tyrosine-type recombinase/integrase [Candidatus Bathyarchaeota archaeon]